LVLRTLQVVVPHLLKRCIFEGNGNFNLAEFIHIAVFNLRVVWDFWQ